MNKLHEKVETTKLAFRKKLIEVREHGGFTRERYIRFLSMQFHLTRGVQKHFFAVAANSIMAKKRELRKWLISFAQEEEFHFLIAQADLRELGVDPLDCPIDIQLWKLFFEAHLSERPFLRLGATCILENIGDGSADILDKVISTSDFLNQKNLRFLIIHRHGPDLAHGDQVLEILSKAELNEDEMSDLLEGAELAKVFYMRAFHWIATGEYLW